MTTLWDDKYPDKKVLRKEITCMLESFVEVLLKEIPGSEIEGIYFKGSGQKEWDSPLDYVPEISDIDIHLLFSADSTVEKYFGTTEKAIAIQSKVEKKYFSKTVKPVHVPRPQLVMLNPVLKEKDFVPSPKSTISVLYGKDYPEPDCNVLKRLRRIDFQHLMNEEEFILKFPLHVVDRPSKYLWQGLRNLVWHISPNGSRVLSIKGSPYEVAWGINRTKIVSLLEELGEHQLVQEYTQFYLSAWDYFLSQYKDTDAGRNAVVAGINALSRAIDIAKSLTSSI